MAFTPVHLPLLTGISCSAPGGTAPTQDSGLCSQRVLWNGSESAGLRAREGLCSKSGAESGGASTGQPEAMQGGGQHPVCTYCSTGDLYTLWKSVGRFAEAVIRLFATELVLVLGYLHNLGIVHRDVKMENILLDERGHLKLSDFGLSRHLPWGKRAYTICGTLQYMAPEVLSGGPYAHSADWWSMGVLLFALATGKFPVAPEKDHVTMLESVKRCSYSIPLGLSLGLRLLLSELLCQDPLRRLRYPHHFRGHLFFRGMTFDAEMLQKQPVDFVLGLRRAKETSLDSAVFSDFDCDLMAPLSHPWPS